MQTRKEYKYAIQGAPIVRKQTHSPDIKSVKYFRSQ